MSSKSKTQRQREESLVLARESKMRRCSSQEESIMEGQFSGTTDEVRTEPEGLAELLVMSGDALDMEDEDVDPSFDLGSSLKSDKRSYDRQTFVTNGSLILTMKIEFLVASFSAFNLDLYLERV